MCKLGLENRLAGRSHECDYPESVQELPILTAPKYPVHYDDTNADIHQSISKLMQNALSIYEVDDEILLELNPDVILTQDHCEVCAASMSDLSHSVREALGKKTDIISASPVDLASVFESFTLIAEKLGVPERGKKLVDDIKSRFDEIAKQTQHLDKPDVVAIEWIDPLMTGGNWMPELIEIAGGINHLATAGEHSPVLKWDEIRETDPDILLVLPCGYPIDRTLKEMHTLEQMDGWNNLKAVESDNVYILDGNHYFNRPGPRIADSAEILAQIFHPSIFAGDTDQPGWIRYSVQSS